MKWVVFLRGRVYALPFHMPQSSLPYIKYRYLNVFQHSSFALVIPSPWEHAAWRAPGYRTTGSGPLHTPHISSVQERALGKRHVLQWTGKRPPTCVSWTPQIRPTALQTLSLTPSSFTWPLITAWTKSNEQIKVTVLEINLSNRLVGLLPIWQRTARNLFFHDEMHLWTSSDSMLLHPVP